MKKTDFGFALLAFLTAFGAVWVWILGVDAKAEMSDGLLKDVLGLASMLWLFGVYKLLDAAFQFYRTFRRAVVKPAESAA
jgi:hypothetical protein